MLYNSRENNSLVQANMNEQQNGIISLEEA
jgi:hypothetical protein